MNSETERARIAGAILAGGRSRRMGGGDKALKPLAGKPMIGHVIQRFTPQVAAAVLVVNGDQAAYQRFGLPIVSDAVGDYAGPLAGLLSGMIWARENCLGAEWAATTPCDTPFMPEGYVETLCASAQDEPDAIVIAESGGRSHFVCGLWPLALQDGLAAWIASGEHRMQGWIERHPHRIVTFPPLSAGAVSIDPFFNVNTPEDYAKAEAFLEEKQP
jgi:molybdenum cofactor guanylyltransferase